MHTQILLVLQLLLFLILHSSSSKKFFHQNLIKDPSFSKVYTIYGTISAIEINLPDMINNNRNKKTDFSNLKRIREILFLFGLFLLIIQTISTILYTLNMLYYKNKLFYLKITKNILEIVPILISIIVILIDLFVVLFMVELPRSCNGYVDTVSISFLSFPSISWFYFYISFQKVYTNVIVLFLSLFAIREEYQSFYDWINYRLFRF